METKQEFKEQKRVEWIEDKLMSESQVDSVSLLDGGDFEEDLL